MNRRRGASLLKTVTLASFAMFLSLNVLAANKPLVACPLQSPQQAAQAAPAPVLLTMGQELDREMPFFRSLSVGVLINYTLTRRSGPKLWFNGALLSSEEAVRVAGDAGAWWQLRPRQHTCGCSREKSARALRRLAYFLARMILIRPSARRICFSVSSHMGRGGAHRLILHRPRKCRSCPPAKQNGHPYACCRVVAPHAPASPANATASRSKVMLHWNP